MIAQPDSLSNERPDIIIFAMFPRAKNISLFPFCHEKVDVRFEGPERSKEKAIVSDYLFVCNLLGSQFWSQDVLYMLLLTKFINVPVLAYAVILAFRGFVFDFCCMYIGRKHISLTTLDFINYLSLPLCKVLICLYKIFSPFTTWYLWCQYQVTIVTCRFSHVPQRSHDIQRDQFLLPYYLWLLR